MGLEGHIKPYRASVARACMSSDCPSGTATLSKGPFKFCVTDGHRSSVFYASAHVREQGSEQEQSELARAPELPLGELQRW